MHHPYQTSFHINCTYDYIGQILMSTFAQRMYITQDLSQALQNSSLLGKISLNLKFYGEANVGSWALRMCYNPLSGTHYSMYLIILRQFGKQVAFDVFLVPQIRTILPTSHPEL